MPSQMTGKRTARFEITIDNGRGLVQTYRLRPLYPIEGSGWRLHKVGQMTGRNLDSYSVFFTQEKGLYCNCPGFENYSFCKHTDALGALFGLPTREEVVNVQTCNETSSWEGFNTRAQNVESDQKSLL